MNLFKDERDVDFEEELAHSISYVGRVAIRSTKHEDNEFIDIFINDILSVDIEHNDMMGSTIKIKNTNDWQLNKNYGLSTVEDKLFEILIEWIGEDGNEARVDIFECSLVGIRKSGKTKACLNMYGIQEPTFYTEYIFDIEYFDQ